MDHNNVQENIWVYCEEEDIEPTSINVAAVNNKILISVEVPNVKLREMSDQQFYIFLKHHQKKFKMLCDSSSTATGKKCNILVLVLSCCVWCHYVID